MLAREGKSISLKKEATLVKKYRNIFVIIVGLLIVFMNFDIYADTSLREYRRNLLNEAKKDAKIVDEGRICRSKHFAVYIDIKSLEDFALTEGETLQDLMLRICFIFEEAYQVVGKHLDGFPSGRFKIDLYSRQMYDRESGKDVSGTYSRRGIRLPIEGPLMKNPLDDFSDGISQLYYAYARLFLYSMRGPGFYADAATDVSNYFKKIGEETSAWKGSITEEKREKILDSINAEHGSLFREYPEYFKNESAEKKFMTCKWCGKEVDVGGKRKGKRIRCSYCGNPIYVE
jgi:DNA-directed RNA polymerase subunit RPC12/RpoP